jgi:hypothetical protein
MFRLSGIYDSLLPLTKWCGGVFNSIRDTGKPPSKMRAADMRHMLLVLPFLLPDLLRPEVEVHNAQIPQADHVVDPSAELVEVVLILLTWYRLLRRRSPAKDEDDIKDLTCYAHRHSIYLNFI